MLPGAIASGQSPPSGPSTVASTLSVSGLSNSWTTPYNIYVYSNTVNSTVGATLVDSSLNITTPSYTSPITPVRDKYYYSVVYAANARGSSFGTQSDIKQVTGYFPITVNNADLGTDYTITNYAGRTFYTFKSLKVGMSITTASSLVVDYFALGGGGGGGYSGAGGGGGGGLQQATGYSLTTGTRNIEIGDGGIGATTEVGAANGADTVFGSIATALGGGAGGGGKGATGGCGGGNSWGATTGGGGDGLQGNNGGLGGGSGSFGGGGGGGVSGLGADGTTNGGNGGEGISYNNGALLQLGGGGGGGSGYGGKGSGRFGGGDGGIFSGNTSGTNGSINTGGGGGGGAGGGDSAASGKKGGSGIFIISYPQFTTTAPFTKSIVNGVEYFKFTGSGTITTYQSMLMNYFAIGGGGSGGGWVSGGGGAGGMKTGTVSLAPGTYPLVIGDGGDVPAKRAGGLNGTNTTFNGITALGGGGGGTVNNGAGSNGGCGGGAGTGSTSPGTSTDGSGFPGGSAVGQGGGGGGGVSSAGSASSGVNGGAGGSGVTYLGVGYGGGGGGGPTTGGVGGTASFGGGAGATVPGSATGVGFSGAPNTGSGGGGNLDSIGGGGGSGVFIASFFTPSLISGLNLWLDANDVLGTGTNPANGTLATWVDKSGNGRNGTAAGTSPALASIPARVTFGGAGYYSTLLSAVPTAETVFFVSSTTSTAQIAQIGCSISPTGGRGIFQASGDMAITSYAKNNRATQTGALTTGVPFITNLVFSGGNSQIFVNGIGGTVVGSTSFSGGGTTNIGAFTSRLDIAFIGSMYEIIIYNSALSDYDRLRVETYLKNKWSIA